MYLKKLALIISKEWNFAFSMHEMLVPVYEIEVRSNWYCFQITELIVDELS